MKNRILALLLLLAMVASLLSGCELIIKIPGNDPPSGGGADVTDGHKDENNDDYCDDCGEYVVVLIDFYAVNDLHGKFADTSDNIGADELTTYLKTMESTDDNFILLSSGDMWQGSSESNLTYGQIMTEWMNHLGFVSMTMGNHEYDWGREYIDANDELADFPFLAINIFDKETNQRIDYCDASVVVERSGLKIGIIGAIGNCYSSISGDMTSGFYFKTGSQLTDLIKEESDRLRSEEDVDLVVLSIHDGYDKNKSGMSSISNSDLRSYYDPSLSAGYVDLVFEAHTHKSYVLMDSEGVFHLQGGGENNGISHVEMKINFANGEKQINEAEIVSKNTYRSYKSDSIVAELLEKYKDDIQKANEVLGTLTRYINSDEICDLVAKVYYEKGLEVWGEEYPIVLGGGFISARSPYELRRGEVTYADVYSVLPFDNELVLCSISGYDLMRVFIETDNYRYHIYYEEYGNDAIANIDLSATYYVITDTYSSTYKSNRLTEIQRLGSGIYARDLLAEYIKDGRLK